jgi:hypothetical protein
MSLLLPRRAGEAKARVTRLKSLPNSLAVRVRFGRVEDTVIFAFEHGLLEAGDVRGRGTWCVVRREAESGRVLAWQMGEGRRLEVAGRVVTRPR